jgi:hypothetical protein
MGMSVSIPPSAITLEYICNDHDEAIRSDQPLVDITDVGTLICPDCGEDMLLVDTRIEGENGTYPDRVIDDVPVPHALAPAYGRVLLILEANAVSYGTVFACFKPADAEWGTPLLEIRRTTKSATVVRL